LPVAYVHFSGSREELLTGREQRAHGRVREADPYANPNPSSHARSRRGPPPVRTTRLRRDGDCRKTVILSIVRAVGFHGFCVN
jgi:hypothetical protein